MKRFFILLLFVFLSTSLFSQNRVSFEEIEKNISEYASFFEGTYIVKANDTTMLGISYALTYYDPETQIVCLCIPDYSKNAYFISYEFPVSEKEVFEDIGSALIINTPYVYYSIDDNGKYFFVELVYEMDGMKIKYEGEFKIEDDPD